MMKKSVGSSRSLTLRQRAEELLQKSRGGIESVSTEDLKVLVHELQVHQIELEIQNEELRNVQLDLEESRDRYTELYDFAPVGYLKLDHTGVILRANFCAEALLGVDRKKLIKAPFSRFIGADSQDTWYLHRRCVVREGSKEVCEVHVRGRHRTLRVESVRREDGTEPEQILTVLLDISEIRKMEGEIQGLNETLRQRIEDRTHELMVSSEALCESQNRMGAILDAAADGIVTIDGEGTIVSFNPAAERMFEYSTQEAIGRSFDTLMGSPDDERGRYLEHDFHALKSIPREFRGLRKSGELFSAELAVREFADGDARRLCASIRDISERRRLEHEIAEISGAERRRISQDLHDGLGQELTGIAFMAGALEHKLAAKSLPEARQMADVVRLISETIEKTRTLARGLCPVNLDGGGLAAALHTLVMETEFRWNVSCLFDYGPEVRIDDNNVANNLYYIAREAINNAIRHGKAKTISVSLVQRSGGITLMVRDDGLGLPEKLPPNKGMGLQIMSYRARTIGGSLTFGTANDGGTVVTCSILGDNYE